MRAGAQCGEGRGLKPVKKKKNSLTNYETHYGNYDIDCLGHAYTVYGNWGLEIWSEQTAKSIFNKRKQFRIFLTTLLNFLFILMSRILKQLLKNTLSSYFCFEDLKSRE